MPHVDGHIITTPSSCGILKMTNGSNSTHLFYVPSPWWNVPSSYEGNEQTQIGFHPLSMKGLKDDTIIAIDVYPKEWYDALEDNKSLVTLGIPNWMEIEKHMLTRIQAYENSNDFTKLYLQDIDDAKKNLGIKKEEHVRAVANAKSNIYKKLGNQRLK